MPDDGGTPRRANKANFACLTAGRSEDPGDATAANKANFPCSAAGGTQHAVRRWRRTKPIQPGGRMAGPTPPAGGAWRNRSLPPMREFGWSLKVGPAVPESVMAGHSRSTPRLVIPGVAPPPVCVGCIIAPVERRRIHVRSVKRHGLRGRGNGSRQQWAVPRRREQRRIVPAIPAVRRIEAGGVRRNRPQVMVHVQAVEIRSRDPVPDQRTLDRPRLANSPGRHCHRKQQREGQPRRCSLRSHNSPRFLAHTTLPIVSYERPSFRCRNQPAGKSRIFCGRDRAPRTPSDNGQYGLGGILRQHGFRYPEASSYAVHAVGSRQISPGRLKSRCCDRRIHQWPK
jgi:hypothetical protein